MNKIYIAGGLAIIILVMLALSSCSVNRGLTNTQIEQRNNIDYKLDKLYLEYSYKRDSLIMEFYNIKKK